MTSLKTRIAIITLLFAIGCSDDPDPVDDAGASDLAPAVDTGADGADVTEKRPEYIRCYELTPEECRLHTNGPGEEEPYKCRVMLATPFDHQAKCFDSSSSERHCVFHNDIGDNSGAMILSPEGTCYSVAHAVRGLPPGWQKARNAEEGEIPGDCRKYSGDRCE